MAKIIKDIKSNFSYKRVITIGASRYNSRDSAYSPLNRMDKSVKIVSNKDFSESSEDNKLIKVKNY